MHLETLEQALGAIRVRSAQGGWGDPAQPLALDRERLVVADEAWVPVSTPDGPGILTWANSH